MLSQPPDLGSFFITPGKSDSTTKGREKPSPNTAMPMMGLRATPSRTAAARMEPTKGPVQEKDTMTIARATKNAAM